jgi:23S rRNA pseudouridine2605 synthase
VSREPDRGERLQKILAHAGVSPSRRKAEDLIRAGRVTVNGRVATLGDRADPEQDHIKLDGRRVELPSSYRYLLLNKPTEVMSTRSDPEGRPTVMESIPEELRTKLVPVGRLDYHTEGLLLLTDDGDLAYRITHPSFGCTKTYEVKVRGEPAEKDLDRLRAGIRLYGRKTAPLKISRSPAARGPRVATQNTWLVVELTEGRTRQIREIFQRIGHPVQRLRRVAIGPLRDPRLPPGQVRELTIKELDALRKATRGGRRRGSGSSGGARSHREGARGEDPRGRQSRGPGRGGGKARRGQGGAGGG